MTVTFYVCPKCGIRQTFANWTAAHHGDFRCSATPEPVEFVPKALADRLADVGGLYGLDTLASGRLATLRADRDRLREWIEANVEGARVEGGNVIV